MGTNFDRMTHEEMLRWLDEAADGEVRGAADRLVGAAKEIRRIAEDLRIRPQRVEWRGEGADAFRTWSADLANATLRLGDYSEGAAKWLTEASDAIASAQTSIPRPDPGTRPSHDAALATRHDPTAPAAARRSAETLLVSVEADRQEAAAQMRRLAQTYELSAAQLTALEEPVFPPLPEGIVPERRARADGERRYVGTGGTGAGSGPSVSGATGRAETSQPPVAMGIDGVAPLPATPPDAATARASSPGASKPEQGLLPLLPSLPLPPPRSGSARPVFGGQGAEPAGRAPGGSRTPASPGRGSVPIGSGTALPRDRGITGGRAVAHAGRPAGALPRGTVAGGEGTDRRLTGQGAGSGSVGTGGPQGRTAARPFTPGGSGLVRRGGAGSAARPGASRSGERPDYLTEDEETWQQPGRRIVPPVID